MSEPQDAAAQPVALVTGSIRGLGLAVARAFAERGDRTHVVWRGSQARVPASEVEFPGRVHRADLTRGMEARRLVEEVLERDGRLDHVVHCVGAYTSGSLEATGFEGWRAMLESNLETALHLADASRDALRASHGTLVFFGCAGLEGLRGRRQAAAYAAAKSALLVLTRSMALEEASFGVRVNMISPGLVPHEDAHAETSDPALLARVPMGRHGTLEEVAQAALWLSSERSSYTVGVDLPVSGGWLL
jgi:NAD(P)-dependent dehydrogenase (short-subunit alcohol dehydrogenase family)